MVDLETDDTASTPIITKAAVDIRTSQICRRETGTIVPEAEWAKKDTQPGGTHEDDDIGDEPAPPIDNGGGGNDPTPGQGDDDDKPIPDDLIDVTIPTDWIAHGDVYIPPPTPYHIDDTEPETGETGNHGLLPFVRW
jgi:hypothetical protein